MMLYAALALAHSILGSCEGAVILHRKRKLRKNTPADMLRCAEMIHHEVSR
jgi:hypothetical protein